MIYKFFLIFLFLFGNSLLQATNRWGDSIGYGYDDRYEEHFQTGYTRRSMPFFYQKEKTEKKPKIILKQKYYNNRLFVGEADFSYTVALLNKRQRDYPNLGMAIVATELKSKQELNDLYPSSFLENINQLREKGVKIYYNIDATRIGEIFSHRYQRIHFNFPHDRSPIYDRTLSNLIKNFA